MAQLTEQGLARVAEIASRHGLSTAAVEHMLQAVAAGQGTQAQFNSPELGGMGQWSLGGMTMVGDMFNNGLKARVDALCTELSSLVRSDALFAAPAASQSQSQGGGFGTPGVSLYVQPAGSAWPAELGQPASVGAQNDLRYAWFPQARRLAIDHGGRVTVYDTGEHQIGGFGQSQGGGQSLTFTSQYGLVSLSDLPVVGAGGTMPEPAPSVAPPASTEALSDEQVFTRIERLAGLFEKGILTEAEFTAKKAELLARL